MLDSFYHMTLKLLEIAFLAWKRQDLASCCSKLKGTSISNVTKSVNH